MRRKVGRLAATFTLQCDLLIWQHWTLKLGGGGRGGGGGGGCRWATGCHDNCFRRYRMIETTPALIRLIQTADLIGASHRLD